MPRGGARPGAGRKPSGKRAPPKPRVRKSKANPDGPGRGGSRPGAGSKIPSAKRRKTPSKETIAAAETLAAEVVRKDLSPVQYLIGVYTNPKVKAERLDRAAVAAAPYLHPRLQGVAFTMAPAPGITPANPVPQLAETMDEGINQTELARRIAFALALGHRLAKEG